MFLVKGVIMRILIVIFMLFAALAVHADNYPHIGKGCTTAYYIDEDCDGYGVGTGYVLGVDADDTNPSINTKATVESLYGEIDEDTDNATAKANLLSFLAARGAADYTGVDDVWYISPTGDDGSGKKNDVSKPYATFGTVRSVSGFGPGDLVILRDGSHDYVIDLNYGLDGANDSPIIIMSLPGELGINTYNGTSIRAEANEPATYITFDTLQIGESDTLIAGAGFSLKGEQNIIVRYVEITNRDYIGFRLQAGDETNDDILIDHCNINRIGDSRNLASYHNMYLGGGTGSYRNILSNSIIHSNTDRSQSQLLHFNGQNAQDNLIENNIFHSSGGKCVDFQTGISNTTFRNNLVFNCNKQAFEIYVYSTADDYVKDNLIINNIFWLGRFGNEFSSVNPSGYTTLRVLNGKDSELLTGNDIVNNIFVNDAATAIYYDAAHYQDTNITNNVIINLDGSESPFYAQGAERTLAWFEGNVVGASGNIYQDPMFKNVSIYYNATPGLFNFNLTENSTARDFGTPNRAPLLDLRGNERSGNPDAGCYEYQSRYHGADSDENDNVSTSELKDYIWLWKGGIVSISSMSSAILEWKNK